MDVFLSPTSSTPCTTYGSAPTEGFIVVSKIAPKPSAPHHYEYSYTHYECQGDAQEHYAGLVNAEYGAWLPVAIVKTRNGLPTGEKV